MPFGYFLPHASPFLGFRPKTPSYRWSLSYMILDLCAEFQPYIMIRSVSRTSHPWSPLLEDFDGSCLFKWRIGSSFTVWSIMICDSFSSLAWLEVCQESLILKVSARRTLMVPDQVLGGCGNSWHHWSSWYVIIDLCAKFQLSSMIRSVSRTPRSRSWYLENIDGSCQETWGWVHPWYLG